MARTKKSQISSRYNEQLKYAKEQFLKETGKRIARGFKDSEDYKRIVRNKNQTLYRFERRQQISRLRSLNIGTDTKGAKLGFKSTPQTKTSIITGGEPFFTALSYGSKSTKAIQDSFNRYKKSSVIKKAVRLAVIDLDGKETIYTSPLQADRAVQRMYLELIKLQKKQKLGSSSIIVDSVKTETPNEVFITITLNQV